MIMVSYNDDKLLWSKRNMYNVYIIRKYYIK